MSKDNIFTVRVDQEMRSAIESLADKDERSAAWMIRKLLEEALVARKAMKPKRKA